MGFIMIDRIDDNTQKDYRTLMHALNIHESLAKTNEIFHIMEVHMTHSQNMCERSFRSNLHFGERVAKDPRKTCYRQKTELFSSFQMSMSSLFVTPHTNCII